MPTDLVEIVSYRVATISNISVAIVLTLRDHRSDTTTAIFYREAVEMFVQDIDRAIADSFPYIASEVLVNSGGPIERELEMAAATVPPQPGETELVALMKIVGSARWTIVPRTTGIVLRREVDGGETTDFHFSPALAHILAFRLAAALGRTTH